ncbi:hypothetical protein BE20_04240 [Sorangium cellulosum]|nr:hypothetical protein BE20_04240 [Sorangium cellulosum]
MGGAHAVFFVTLTENDVVHLVPDEEGAYRIGVPTGSRTYELHGLPLGEEGVLAFQTVLDAADEATDLAYDRGRCRSARSAAGRCRMRATPRSSRPR